MLSRKRFPLPLTMALSGLLLLTACDGDKKNGGSGGGEPALLSITPQQASTTVTDNLRSALTTSAQAVDFVSKTRLASELSEVADRSQAGAGSATTNQANKLRLPIAATDPLPRDGADETGDLVNQVNDFVDWLQQHVFDQAESSTDTAVVYRLRPELCEKLVGQQGDCASVGGSASEGEGEGEGANDGCGDSETSQEDVQQCQKLLTDVPIRFEVTSQTQGDMDVTLLVDDLRTMTLSVHAAKLGYEIDLGASKAAVERIMTALAEDPQQVELPSVLEGRVRLELEVTGDEQVSLTGTVLDTVRITIGKDDQTMTASVAPSTYTLDVDGIAKTLTATLDSGAFDLTMPYQAFIDSLWEDDSSSRVEAGNGDTEDPKSPHVSGSLLLHLAGLTGSVVLDAAHSEQLTLTGLGLGDGASWAKHDGTTLVSVDLNAQTGRKLDLTITPGAAPVDSASGSGDDGQEEPRDGELPTLTFKPGLDLSLLFNLQAMAQDLRDAPPRELLNETWRVLLDGAAQPAVRLRSAQVTDKLEAALEVLAGTLTISTTALDAPIVVEQGKCLAGPADEDDEYSNPPSAESGSGEQASEADWVHPFSELQSVDCPAVQQ